MLKSICGTYKEKLIVADQAKKFYEHSNQVLFSQRIDLKVKAEFSVLLAIFDPEKVFTTMNELLLSVEWD